MKLFTTIKKKFAFLPVKMDDPSQIVFFSFYYVRTVVIDGKTWTFIEKDPPSPKKSRLHGGRDYESTRG